MEIRWNLMMLNISNKDFLTADLAIIRYYDWDYNWELKLDCKKEMLQEIIQTQLYRPISLRTHRTSDVGLYLILPTIS